MTTEPTVTSNTDAQTSTQFEQFEQERYERGMRILNQVDGESGHKVVNALADVAPGLAHHGVAFAFGDLYGRPGLTPQQRQLVTLGMLTALGGCEPELDVHINASLNVGLTTTEVVEALTHSAAYCGFPRAINAMSVAKRVFADRGLLPLGEAAAS